MPLDQKAIDELKKLHFEEFGEELSNEEAWDMGINLLNFVKALSRGAKTASQNESDNLTTKPTSRYD